MREITVGSVNDALLGAGIEKFWTSIEVRPSRLDRVTPVVALDVRYHDVTFEELCAISDALGTRHINLENQVRESGYCDTCRGCRYSYTITVITVMGARLPELAAAE